MPCRSSTATGGRLSGPRTNLGRWSSERRHPDGGFADRANAGRTLRRRTRQCASATANLTMTTMVSTKQPHSYAVLPAQALATGKDEKDHQCRIEEDGDDQHLGAPIHLADEVNQVSGLAAPQDAVIRLVVHHDHDDLAAFGSRGPEGRQTRLMQSISWHTMNASLCITRHPPCAANAHSRPWLLPRAPHAFVVDVLRRMRAHIGATLTTLRTVPGFMPSRRPPGARSTPSTCPPPCQLGSITCYL
jgi:hypothetical protein